MLLHAHAPLPPFVADDDNVLIEAIRRDWSAAYLVDVDGNGICWALRRDGLKALSARLPVTLLAAIIDDFEARPVTDLDQLPRLEKLRREHPEVIILRMGPVPTAWIGPEKITGTTLAGMLDKLDAALRRAVPGSRPAPAGTTPAPGTAPGAGK
jgi:hypothetical protein